MATRGTRASVALRTGSDARADCYAYPGTAPILVVDGGTVYLTITTTPTPDHTTVTARDVKFARQLAKATAVYLAECERLHRHDGTETGCAA